MAGKQTVSGADTRGNKKIGFILPHRLGTDSVGNKVEEAVTGTETTGSDDQKRSNQCHYVCIE